MFPFTLNYTFLLQFKKLQWECGWKNGGDENTENIGGVNILRNIITWKKRTAMNAEIRTLFWEALTYRNEWRKIEIKSGSCPMPCVGFTRIEKSGFVITIYVTLLRKYFYLRITHESLRTVVTPWTKSLSQSNQHYILLITWLGDLISVKAGDEVDGRPGGWEGGTSDRWGAGENY